MRKKFRAKIQSWFTPWVNLLHNLFQPNCFRVGYVTELKLALAEGRIKEYAKVNTRLLNEQHINKARMILLEGSMKAVIAAYPRGCVYIQKEDIKDASKRWRQIDTKEKDGKIRFQVRENKEWRKEHVGEPTDDARENRRTGPTGSDIVGT